MMTKGDFTVVSNTRLAKDIYKIVLEGDTGAVTVPGQFVNVAIGGFLRRPFSACDVNGDMLTLIYKTVGDGTRRMAELKKGEKLDILVGLGNGFDISKSGDAPLVIGGGAGIPPLYFLCKRLVAFGTAVRVLLGFTSADGVFYVDEFRALGADVTVYTDDGSFGKKGRVTDGMSALQYTYFYACGPEAMLRSVDSEAKTAGQFSLEERMGCGFGACMGCSVKTVNGTKRLCKEGPVLEKGEILWRAPV